MEGEGKGREKMTHAWMKISFGVWDAKCQGSEGIFGDERAGLCIVWSKQQQDVKTQWTWDVLTIRKPWRRHTEVGEHEAEDEAKYIIIKGSYRILFR